MHRVQHRILDTLLWVLGMAPTLWFLAFYTFALRGRLVLGDWSTLHQTDPQSLAFSFHYGLVLALLIGVIPSVIGFAAVRVFRRMRGITSAVDRPLTIYYLGSYLLWWVVARVDPEGLIAWFAT